MDDPSIWQLRGFLKAAQALCGDRARFWADQVPIDGSVEKTLQEHFARPSTFEEQTNQFAYESQHTVSYDDFLALLDDFIFSRFASQIGDKTTFDLRAFLLSYFQEFEISSELTIAPNNPIVSRTSTRVFATRPAVERALYLAIPYKRHALVLGLEYLRGG